MRLWRICRQRYSFDAFRGEGARLHGGRWNRPGVAVVYASTSLALAAMETFVNLEPSQAPSDLIAIAGQLPDDQPIARLELATLPQGWSESRDESLHRFGDEWVRASKTAAILVPSAALHGEWNILLNPAHRGFAQIVFSEPEPFRFDARMFARRAES